jgi:hypothetical protein
MELLLLDRSCNSTNTQYMKAANGPPYSLEKT